MKSKINSNYQPTALIIAFTMVFLCAFLHVDTMTSMTRYLTHAQSRQESIILPCQTLSNELDVPRSSTGSSIGTFEKPEENLLYRTGAGTRHGLSMLILCIPSLWQHLVRAYLPRLFSRNILSLERSVITYLHRSDGMKPLPIA